MFSVPKNEAELLRVDEKVNVLIGDDAEAHVAVIEFVSPTTNAETGTTQVKVKIDNPEHKIQSGAQCVLVVNSDSVVTKAKDRFKTRNVSAKSVR